LLYVFKSLAFIFSIHFCLASAYAAQPFVTIRAGGDTMIANTPSQAIPTKQFLKNLIPEMQAADITFLNYEGTLCDEDTRSHKCSGDAMCFAFRSPTRFVKDLVEAGVNVVNIANNHIFDYGHSCATTTKNTLENSGILSVGLMNRQNPKPDDTIGFYKHNGKNILFLGFHYSDAWGRVISVNQEDTVRALIRKYKNQADIIVASMHVGAEGPKFTSTPQTAEIYKGENRGDVRRFARLLVNEGVDLVIGHGPHVLRGMEIINDRLVIYSLGNFATYDLFKLDNPLDIGALVEAQLAEDGRFIGGQIVPIRQHYIPGNQRGREVVVDIDDQLTAIKMIQKLSQQDFSSYPRIDDNGVMKP
jgi:poly-gamma-glutamate capsule biosynthesis protein CapA/YwtB (metallophosphatase superfamily)